MAPAEVLGRQISKASAGIDTQGGSAWYVSLTFNGEGTTAFGALTTRVTTLAAPLNQVAIVLDGLVVSSPRITEPIPSGNAQITGSFTQLEAQDLANVLKYGALPLSFDRGEVQQVSPTLENNSMLIDRRWTWFVTCSSLPLLTTEVCFVTVGSLQLLALLSTFFLLLGKWIDHVHVSRTPAPLLTGVTADSFIIYFERVREPVKADRCELQLRPLGAGTSYDSCS